MSFSTSAIAVAGLVGVLGVAAYASPAHSHLILGVGGAVVSSVALFLLSKGSCFSCNVTALSPTEWREFPLISKQQISPNTAIYRLKLQTPTTRLGLPIGQHVSIQSNIDGKDIQRSYTPISSDDDLGFMDLLIKTYPQGNISRVFANLKIGDKIKMKGPKGQFKYIPNMMRELGMVAGGTGLTPMLQVIKAILYNPLDNTKIKFIFANVSVQDILLKDQLDELAASYPDRFSIYYVLNTRPEGWTGEVGFVTGDMIAKYLPAPAKDVKILLCGPPPMIKALTVATETLGFDKVQPLSKAGDQVFKF